MRKNNRDKGYSVRCDDDELINIDEAKKKLNNIKNDLNVSQKTERIGN